MLKVEEVLNEKNLPFRIIRLKEKAMSASEVLEKALDPIKEEEVCKTVMLNTKKGDAFGVFIKGDKRIDFKKLQKLIKGKISILSPEKVEEFAQAKPGAVCPVLLKVPLYIDVSVLELENVNCGSGDLMHGLEMKLTDLLKFKKYEKIDVSM